MNYHSYQLMINNNILTVEVNVNREKIESLFLEYNRAVRNKSTYKGSTWGVKLGFLDWLSIQEGVEFKDPNRTVMVYNEEEDRTGYKNTYGWF